MYPCKHQFYYIKVGFNWVYTFNGYVFPMPYKFQTKVSIKKLEAELCNSTRNQYSQITLAGIFIATKNYAISRGNGTYLIRSRQVNQEDRQLHYASMCMQYISP